MECEYRAGKTVDATAVFKALPDLAEKMASAASRNDALKHITLVQLRLGLFDDALATTRKIPDNNARSHVLRDIAQSLAEKGKRDQAKALMPEMAYPLHRWMVQGAIVVSLARDGEFKVAIDMAKTMPGDEAATSQALMIIATLQAKAHFTDEAIISAERISDGANKCIAFEEIAREQIRIGKKNDAFKSLAQARQAATEIRNADAALHLAEVAALYGKAGDSAKADDAFVKAFQLARKMNGLLLQSDALQKISWGQIRAGDKRAIDTLVESLAFLTKRQEAGTDSAHKRLQTICGFAAVMARDGWPSGVEEALTALRDENPVIQAWFCISVARAFIEKQHPAEKIDWDNL
jgi:tetratricopeptide (TPR) repeat protein